MHSLDFSREAIEIKNRLEEKGYVVSQCYSVTKMEEGKFSVEEVKRLKKGGEFSEYTISKDLIRWNWERMKKDDAVLVINISKNGIENYIGGNTFLEMGFAHVLNKKIFLWNDIPQMHYTDEIKAMKPIIIRQNIDLLE
ncbi:MAG: hypothetical protein WC693_00600 [Patescibacteria group bacterium]|jgi:hypothetical protein